MRPLSLASLLLGFLGAAAMAGTGERAWLTSFDAALAESMEGDRLILVDLYAEWCGWCKLLDEEVFSSRAFQDYASDFVLLRVDTEDGGEGTRLQDRYGVFSLPTTLVLDRRKVKVGEIRGFAPTDQYIARIEHEIAAYRELEAGFRRFRQSTDERAIAVLAEEFHQRGDGDRAAELYRRLLTVGEPTPSRRDWVRYQLADALRIAGRFDEALKETRSARSSASQVDDESLVERLDLLVAEIAIDRGDCQRARSALEDFLGRHPASDLGRYARQTLAALKSEAFRCT